MLNLSEFHFPMPCDHDPHNPPKPRYTAHEDMEAASREMYKTIGRMLDFEKQLNDKVEKMLSLVTSDNVTFKETFNNAYRVFLEDVRNEVNGYESNMDSAFRLFTTTIEHNYASLSDDCKAQISEYYNDIILYIKHNIEGALADTLNKMVENGELTEVIENHVFPDLMNYYVYPEQYGAVCDGVTEDTAAILEACATGKPVYIRNSVLGECTIENATLIFDNTTIIGEVKVKNVDVTGKLIINGGCFVVDYTGATNKTRDNSNFHNLDVDITKCGTFLTLTGTMYNFRFCDNTIAGKCDNHVISLVTNTWITYTIISNSFLGECDQPIYIESNDGAHAGIGGIHIANVYAQKYNATKECRFISTNSFGNLYLDGSFMYDLTGDDVQIYIRRNDGHNTRFQIISVNETNNMTSVNYAKDSDGNKGQALFGDISDRVHLRNSYAFPTPLVNTPKFYKFADSAICYGMAQNAVVPNNAVMGTIFKVGNANRNTGKEIIIGANYDNDKLVCGHRTAEGDFTVKTYDAKEDGNYVSNKTALDKYGDGKPVFYVPLHKIVIKYGSTYYDAVGNTVTIE